MGETKIVVRLLGYHGILLGWAQVMAVARGDGWLWSQGPVQVTVEQEGSLQFISLHWADVNVEICGPAGGETLMPGKVVTLTEGKAPIFQVGDPPKSPLPPVTQRVPVNVSLPAGRLGARGR